MKQYLLPEQTAKLIELGFDRPKNRLVKQRFDRSTSSWIVVGEEGDYSTGELLSFLPKEIDSNGFKNTLYIFVNQDGWCVEYSDFLGELYSTYRSEFIDAIFDMCVKLKEEGVI